MKKNTKDEATRLEKPKALVRLAVIHKSSHALVINIQLHLTEWVTNG